MEPGGIPSLIIQCHRSKSTGHGKSPTAIVPENNLVRSVPAIKRIMERVIPEPNSGCLIWLGYLDKDGYGKVVDKTKRHSAFMVHRVMYEHFIGSIPHGLTINHKCRVRCCCNPDHLEPMENVQNVMIGESIFAKNARKTECKRGHPLSGNNLVIYRKGERQCRTCINMASRIKCRNRRLKRSNVGANT
jgi:HNH endonuclease